MTETDTFYIGRCMNGHPDDFRFLVERYQGALLGHLMSQLRNRDHAEEAAPRHGHQDALPGLRPIA